MKKLMLFFAGVFMLGIAAVNAQQVDTTGTKTQTPSATQQPSATQPSATQSDQYIQKDYEMVKSTDVPSSLRTTLKGSEYTGWESGSVYRNKSNNGYMVRVGSGDQTKNYYFDKGGKRIQDPGSSRP
ncbi:hypothetical protein [Ohtaekwangia koreensis]|uniref:Uncharacterized protein n=1 Tax=Ohtaekwangia koreensis TaxID=688867 RepID=A0A1T5MCJ2_9BACT|nr:hypothetical protein [Ohtaekwangia koreensis]SKC85922.1 hypothetical protein SAMN05660236_4995 [Ohtaekwangia koreensis]